MSLDYDVFVAEPIPQNVPGRVPNGDHFMWSPQTTTLVYGVNDAILIDPPYTTAQATDVAEWIAHRDKRLTHIFITHGHGDHWFTAGLLAARFGAQVVATPGTIALMHAQLAARESTWDVLFPGQIPQVQVTATPAENNRIPLESHTLQIVEVGHSDTDDTTVLHAPDAGLVVAGDVIYNGVHQYLAESTHGGLRKWLAAVDIVESLHPTSIVAGHKNPALDDNGPRAIAETRQYLLDAERLLNQHTTAEGFFEAMLHLYPNRLNPTAIWMGATALYG